MVNSVNLRDIAPLRIVSREMISLRQPLSDAPHNLKEWHSQAMHHLRRSFDPRQSLIASRETLQDLLAHSIRECGETLNPETARTLLEWIRRNGGERIGSYSFEEVSLWSNLLFNPRAAASSTLLQETARRRDVFSNLAMLEQSLGNTPLTQELREWHERLVGEVRRPHQINEIFLQERHQELKEILLRHLTTARERMNDTTAEALFQWLKRENPGNLSQEGTLETLIAALPHPISRRERLSQRHTMLDAAMRRVRDLTLRQGEARRQASEEENNWRENLRTQMRTLRIQTQAGDDILQRAFQETLDQVEAHIATAQERQRESDHLDTQILSVGESFEQTSREIQQVNREFSHISSGVQELERKRQEVQESMENQLGDLLSIVIGITVCCIGTKWLAANAVGGVSVFPGGIEVSIPI